MSGIGISTVTTLACENSSLEMTHLLKFIELEDWQSWDWRPGLYLFIYMYLKDRERERQGEHK